MSREPHPAVALGARRAQRILRQVARRPMTTAEIVRAIKPENLLDQDPVAHSLKIRATVQAMAAEGRLIPGPAGWSPAPSEADRQEPRAA